MQNLEIKLSYQYNQVLKAEHWVYMEKDLSQVLPQILLPNYNRDKISRRVRELDDWSKLSEMRCIEKHTLLHWELKADPEQLH